jgi:hypothetical protein
MLRLVLIGVGVISTALAGYLAKRKFFNRSEELPSELKVYPPSVRSRGKKSRRNQFNEVLDNGQPDDATDLA